MFCRDVADDDDVVFPLVELVELERIVFRLGRRLKEVHAKLFLRQQGTNRQGGFIGTRPIDPQDVDFFIYDLNVGADHVVVRVELPLLRRNGKRQFVLAAYLWRDALHDHFLALVLPARLLADAKRRDFTNFLFLAVVVFALDDDFDVLVVESACLDVGPDDKG